MQAPPPYPPPPYPPPAWGSAAAPPPEPARGHRRWFWIPLAAALVAVLLAAAVFGGYAIGRARAAQPAPHTVRTSFVTFQLARGWSVAGQTDVRVDLGGKAGASMGVRLGNAREDGVSDDADVFRNEVLVQSRPYPRARVGSCLPVTRVTIGGKAGEEVGVLVRTKASGGAEYCDLVWADVQGSRYYYWNSLGGTGGLSKRIKAMQEMQRTAVWSR